MLKDLGCEESAYDAYEYESEGCDDPGTADEYENQMHMQRTGYNHPTGYAGYGERPSYEGGPRYYMCDDQVDSDGEYDTEDDCSPDCVPCGDPSNAACPLPDPNVQCPPCVLDNTCTVFDDETGFADHGANSICDKNLQRVNEIITNITTFTVLDEFMLSIANYTADNGEAMFDAMSNEVNNFKELIKEIYANRNDAVSELLKAEQRQMKNKYEKLTKQMEKKTEETLDQIREILPDFDLAAFATDPSNYIYSAMMEKFKRQQPSGVSEITSLSPDRNFRIAMHKRTWLMRESERVECDNEERMCKLNELMSQLACLSGSLATNNKKLAAYNRQLESHATCLRNKLAYNETVLSCLTDEIDINKIDAGKDNDDCPLIEPDDILTPYQSGYDFC